MDLITKLNWRYATKRYTRAKVPAEKLNKILEAIRLSASSLGLQPYNVLVIDNEELRRKILPVANNQPQITEASHLLIFAAWENITEQKINDYILRISEVRGVPIESLAGFKTMVGGFLGRGQEINFNWAARQAYIALCTGLVAAAMEDVDASPMEGFNSEGIDELLKLKEKGLKSVAFMALGYRDVDRDPIVNAKKVRRKMEDLFINY